MLWFIVIALNLTMGVAWHRFLAFFNVYYKRHSDGSPSLGELPEMLSHGRPIDFEDPAEDDVFGLGTRADAAGDLPAGYLDDWRWERGVAVCRFRRQ